MDPYQPITVSRDVEAVLIPQGTPITLKAGTEVYPLQTLGGSATVNVNGNLARIAGRDLDAIGLEPQLPPTFDHELSDEELEQAVWDQLRTCYDPEIPINIVELGLIYDCHLEPIEEGSKERRAVVDMTLTAPFCGMGEVLVEDARAKLEELPRIAEARVRLVFDPPWDPSRMSEAARLETGMF